MNWKHWPYWVKGGVAGFIITTIFFYGKLLLITSETAPPICKYDGGWEIIGKKCSVAKFVLMNYKKEIIVTTILFAILGWLYGKIKDRKKSSPPLYRL